jgi:DNA-binding response OmpR family regulator
MKVLIVEKDKTLAHSLSYFMKYEKNLEVFVAFSKEEGESLFRSINFDVVLCGDHLTDGDGLMMLKDWMVQKPQLISILMTVKNDERLREKAFNVGIRGYLVKPFNLKDLERIIFNL